MNDLYFLTKKQLIDMCLQQKEILNCSEQMLEKMAEQLSVHSDQMLDIDSKIQETESKILKNRSEIKNQSTFNVNFNDK